VIKTFDDLPSWQFDVSEVSSGVYQLIVRDANGHRRLFANGTDPGTLMQDGRKEALLIHVQHKVHSG
jgi:hypothetical protein